MVNRTQGSILAKVATSDPLQRSLIWPQNGGGHGELLTLVDGRGWGRIDSDTRKSPSGKWKEGRIICNMRGKKDIIHPHLENDA